MSSAEFHPAVAAWFGREFDAPTDVQRKAWSAIAAGSNTLISAPTGSGKTLAAFLAVIDGLVTESVESGLTDETRVLYVSPLKALSNDIQKNLQQPLAGIRDGLLETGCSDAPTRQTRLQVFLFLIRQFDITSRPSRWSSLRLARA